MAEVLTTKILYGGNVMPDDSLLVVFDMRETNPLENANCRMEIGLQCSVCGRVNSEVYFTVSDEMNSDIYCPGCFFPILAE